MADDLDYTARVASVAYVRCGVLGRRAVTRSLDFSLCRRVPWISPWRHVLVIYLVICPECRFRKICRVIYP